jgi:hypothetical protein
VNVVEIVAKLESAGGELVLVGEQVKYRVPSKLSPLVGHLRAHKEEIANILRRRRGVESIPTGAILLALRYDGANRPLASVPKCWCCRVSYRLERLQKSRGKTYAFLEPGCRCLDAWMCYRCFVCREHCRCSSDTNTTPKTPQEVFRTPTGDGVVG